MRSLTISRGGLGFRGDFGILKIYIEDQSADFTIKGVPCRLLGEIKGGESKSFEIEEKQVTIFAIMSKFARNYKYDYRVIESGSADVFLCGNATYERFIGYMFLFDGLTPPEVKEDFGRWKKIILVLIIAAVIVGVMCGLLFPKYL